MAVKTAFEKEQFLEILAGYNIGLLRDFKPLTGGTVQTNYVLRTTKGKYVFRYYENRPRGSVLFEVELLSFLKSRNFPCAAPIKNRSGRFMAMYQGKPYALFDFMGGFHLKKPTERQNSQLIEVVARLQELTKGYDSPNKRHRWNYGPELCLKLVKKKALEMDTAAGRRKLAWFKKELALLELPTSIPKGICHCDYHPSNVLYKGGKLNALIDFDDANYTYLTFDLAWFIDSFFWSFTQNNWDKKHFSAGNAFKPGKVRGIIADYSRHRPLSKIEQAHLYDVLKLCILIDCIWYFSRGNLPDFYEKRKIDLLNELSRARFNDALFP